MKIWLDDQLDDPELLARQVPKGWVGAKNFEQFKKLIEESINSGEPIDALDFDNDLGTKENGELEETGLQILYWLKDTHPEIIVGNTEISVHSQNNIDGPKIKEMVEFCRNHRSEILEAKNRPRSAFGEVER